MVFGSSSPGPFEAPAPRRAAGSWKMPGMWPGWVTLCRVPGLAAPEEFSPAGAVCSCKVWLFNILFRASKVCLDETLLCGLLLAAAASWILRFACSFFLFFCPFAHPKTSPRGLTAPMHGSPPLSCPQTSRSPGTHGAENTQLVAPVDLILPHPTPDKKHHPNPLFSPHSPPSWGAARRNRRSRKY